MISADFGMVSVVIRVNFNVLAMQLPTDSVLSGKRPLVIIGAVMVEYSTPPITATVSSRNSPSAASVCHVSLRCLI